MRTRFNLQKENLDSYLNDAIMVIETLQDLKFDHAEDWTMKSQGYLLYFKGGLFKSEEQTYDETILNIKAQFCHNPSTKTIAEDTSYFERLECCGKNEWRISINYNGKPNVTY